MTDAPASPARALLDPRRAAARLGRSLDWFYRNRKRLEAAHGFPPPVGGCGGRWDPAAIDAWLDAQLPAHLRQSARAAVPDPGAPPGAPPGTTWESWMIDQARKPHEGEAA
jgi:predicted DNA-binding transcriptional regulator AlpA